MGLSDSLMVEALHCSEDPAGHLMSSWPRGRHHYNRGSLYR